MNYYKVQLLQKADDIEFKEIDNNTADVIVRYRKIVARMKCPLDFIYYIVTTKNEKKETV